MKNSDVIKSILLTSINELAADPKKFAVNPGKDFTRNRKMGFEDTVLMLLTMEADCIKEEIYRYFGRSIEAPSKSAFYKQRSKLNRQALANLLYIFNAKLSKKLYKGKYQLIACDGSTVEIFHNPNDPDTEFDFEEFKSLYHLRWTEENAFRDLKYPLCLNSFHSKKIEYIEQEIWARAVLHNFCTAIILDVKVERRETKHEYQVNFSEAFKICRDFLRIHDAKTKMEVELTQHHIATAPFFYLKVSCNSLIRSSATGVKV